MREPAVIRMLPDGRRLHLNDGPIDLIIGAEGTTRNVATAYEAAARRFVTILDELCSELSLLRLPVSEDSPRPFGLIAKRMDEAVRPYGANCFITPMAAVAGAVAETVLESMLATAPLDRVYVNNGGDIALHLGEGQSYVIGMVERPDRSSLFGSIELSAEMPVHGVATSGWRGRSFSLGIADAVTILADTASAADAAATIVGNAVDLPGHHAITRLPAREIFPDSDLRDMLVTRDIGPLTWREIDAALDAGALAAESLCSERRIHAAALCLQGRTRIVSISPEYSSPKTTQTHPTHA